MPPQAATFAVPAPAVPTVSTAPVASRDTVRKVPLRIRGELTLAGATKPVDLVANAKAGSRGELRVEGRYLLRMTDWGVKPPTLMLGTMKVREAVVIRFDFALARK